MRTLARSFEGPFVLVFPLLPTRLAPGLTFFAARIPGELDKD